MHLVEPHHVVLDVEGMTCAACAARIEKNLNKLPSPPRVESERMKILPAVDISAHSLGAAAVGASRARGVRYETRMLVKQVSDVPVSLVK